MAKETLLQRGGVDDLTAEQQNRLWLRIGHVLEAETGFRSGDPAKPTPGEPSPCFDPATTTMTQRRQAKIAQLQGREESELLGLAQMSERTLKRLAAAYWREGPAGCIDGRLLRSSSGHPSVGAEVREAIEAVHAETLHRSRIAMRTRGRLIHQDVRERFGPEIPVPHYTTLRRVWREWYGPGGGRQRYLRSASGLDTSGEHAVVHRPGQVVAMDTSPLPVKVREHVFGDAVTAYLVLALDVYTHSLVGFRLTVVSDTAIDVAMGDRTLYDLHRTATHANLPIQETPMSAAVAKVMWSRIQNNALKQQPTTRAGLMINGGATKTRPKPRAK